MLNLMVERESEVKEEKLENQYFQALTKSGCVILGDNNTIKGAHNKIFGSYNKVIGSKNVIQGHQNFIVGAENTVEGISNVVIGSKCQVKETPALKDTYTFCRYLKQIESNPFQFCSDQEIHWMNRFTTPASVLQQEQQSEQKEDRDEKEPEPEPEQEEDEIPPLVDEFVLSFQTPEREHPEPASLAHWESVVQQLSRQEDTLLGEENPQGVKVCQLCFSHEIKTVNLNCGHSVSCLTCARTWIQTHITKLQTYSNESRKKLKCPICNQELKNIIEIFH